VERATPSPEFSMILGYYSTILASVSANPNSWLSTK
jgi:hypothetical protein